MEEEDTTESQINFIPCLYFVKRGIAKENPDKVTLTQEELAKVINETRRELDDEEDDEDGGSGGDRDTTMDTSDNEESQTNGGGGGRGRQSSNRANDENRNPDDEFNFDAYDEEESTQVAGIGDIAVIDPNEQYDEQGEDNDSEAEDDLIKPTDNLVIVGHVDDDAASLEVFIYNEEEGSFYVHHDFLLPSYPLCIEWMHYDPETKDPGNMVAIGSMDPVITIWDLDIQDTLEPVVKLGNKRNRRRNIEAMGHTDAVLDLSWNEHYPHILASGSVDQTVLLWDMDAGKPHTTITDFDEKVQSVKFHPTEPHHLLTGSCDGTVKLFDCRDPEQISANKKIWSFNGEIERIAWDLNDMNYFFAATNNGKVYYIDIRQGDGERLWSKRVHDQEVTGVILNSSCRGMLTTTSADGNLKVWKYDTTGAQLVYSEETNIGRVQCMGVCTDNQFTVAIGGDNKRKNLRVVNLKDFEAVQRGFGLNV